MEDAMKLCHIYSRCGLSLTLLIGALLISTPAVAADEDATQRLEREVAELRALMEELKNAGLAEERLAEVEKRLEVLAVEVENLKMGEAAVVATVDGARTGLGPAASKVYGVDRGVSVGGYGEALLELFDDTREDGEPSGKTDQFDMLRGVLYFGYKFDDRFVFNSEIEFEHASTSKSGSASVEFAYVDYLWKEGFNLRAGLVLLPMGWINELHEPTVFLGANRPRSERQIIPTTWRENGVGAHGAFGDFDYRTYVVNGLYASGFSDSGLRGGRQKGAKAKAEDFAWVGRLDYTGVPGLTAGFSAYMGDSGQDLVDGEGNSIAAGTTILDLHVDYRYQGFQLRGLYTRAEVDDVARLNEALGYEGSASVGETLVGAYIEAGYDVFAGKRSSLIPYVRAEWINTQEEVPDGWMSDPANDQQIFTLGLAYQPIEQLIVKMDYQKVTNQAETGVDQIGLSMGYIF
jgi:hypothetical protein